MPALRRAAQPGVPARIVALLPVVLVLLVLPFALGGCGLNDPAPVEETATPGPAERFQSPRTLRSYRYQIEVSVDGSLLDPEEAPAELRVAESSLEITIDGHWVSPDHEFSSATLSLSFLSMRLETIRIGSQIWSSVSGGPWREQEPLTDPGSLVGQDVPLSPDALFGPEDPELMERLTADLETRPFTVEVLDGRVTRHWRLDAAWLDQYSGAWDEILAGIERGQGLELTIDLWADVETGVGIRLAAVGSFPGEEGLLSLDMELFDINDPTITVEPPNGAIER